MSSLYGGQGLRGPTGTSQGQKLSGYKTNQLQQFSPEQMQLFQSLFSHVSPDSYLSKLSSGDENTFSQMEAPALRQFSELQGNLASRFSGMGMGARRSSGFQNASNQAASDFLQDLQSRRQSLQRQALQDLMGMSRDLLSERPYETFLTPSSKKSFWQKIIGGGLPLAGAGLGALLAGPVGAGIGGKLGSSASEAFF